MEELNILGNIVELERVEDASHLPMEYIHAFLEFQMTHGGHCFEDSVFNARDYDYLVREMDISALKAAVEAHEDYPDTFDAFIKGYLNGKDAVDYGDSLWPLILDEEEIISDGWHRFISYVERGLEKVPVLLIKEKMNVICY